MTLQIKVDSESIVEAAISIIRRDGYDKITIRAIAREIGCSTQPIYFVFDGMDSLRNELINRIYSIYCEHYKKCQAVYSDVPYIAYGMGLVKFAKEEPQLFRYIYFYEWVNNGANPNEPIGFDLRSSLDEQLGADYKNFDRIHDDMIAFTFGMACLTNFGVLDLKDDDILARMSNQFSALCDFFNK